ncbi:unnamed protein product, partial [Rhizoctonia solani]
MPPRTEDLYRDICSPYQRRAWWVSGLNSRAKYLLIFVSLPVGTSSVAEYSARLAFGVTQINNTNLTIPETYVELGLGQTTKLTTNAEGFTHWSQPTGKLVPADGPLKAVNDTGDQKDISIGSLDVHNSNFLPIICWPRVNNGGAATVNFAPD